MYKSTITRENVTVKTTIKQEFTPDPTNEDDEQRAILQLLAEIDNFLGIVKTEAPEIKPEQHLKPKEKPNHLVKITMRKGNVQKAKTRLRNYAERYGRVQRLWVESSNWAIHGHILFDHVLRVKRCLRDKKAMGFIKNAID